MDLGCTEESYNTEHPWIRLITLASVAGNLNTWSRRARSTPRKAQPVIAEIDNRCENNRQLKRRSLLALHSDNSKRERGRESVVVVVVICGRLRFRQFSSESNCAPARDSHGHRFGERGARTIVNVTSTKLHDLFTPCPEEMHVD